MLTKSCTFPTGTDALPHQQVLLRLYLYTRSRRTTLSQQAHGALPFVELDAWSESVKSTAMQFSLHIARPGITQAVFWTFKLTVSHCSFAPLCSFVLQRGVHESTKEFLKRLSTRLQEESINWGQKHDDDLQSKDRDLEVGKPSGIPEDDFKSMNWKRVKMGGRSKTTTCSPKTGALR